VRSSSSCRSRSAQHSSNGSPRRVSRFSSARSCRTGGFTTGSPPRIRGWMRSGRTTRPVARSGRPGRPPPAERRVRSERGRSACSRPAPAFGAPGCARTRSQSSGRSQRSALRRDRTALSSSCDRRQRGSAASRATRRGRGRSRVSHTRTQLLPRRTSPPASPSPTTGCWRTGSSCSPGSWTWRRAATTSASRRPGAGRAASRGRDSTSSRSRPVPWPMRARARSTRPGRRNGPTGPSWPPNGSSAGTTSACRSSINAQGAARTGSSVTASTTTKVPSRRSRRSPRSSRRGGFSRPSAARRSAAPHRSWPRRRSDRQHRT
jgi:hypothetical protein